MTSGFDIATRLEKSWQRLLSDFKFYDEEQSQLESVIHKIRNENHDGKTEDIEEKEYRASKSLEETKRTIIYMKREFKTLFRRCENELEKADTENDPQALQTIKDLIATMSERFTFLNASDMQVPNASFTEEI